MILARPYSFQVQSMQKSKHHQLKASNMLYLEIYLILSLVIVLILKLLKIRYSSAGRKSNQLGVIAKEDMIMYILTWDG